MNQLNKRALVVVTSNDKLGNTEKKTGWHLSEVTHVFWPLFNDGFEVDFASPKGGMAPVDRDSMKLDDPENKSFVEKLGVTDGIETRALKDIDPSLYGVIYLAGGHGTMWDFPNNPDIQRLVSTIYEKGNIVAAVCHGPSALTEVKLSDGSYLVAGKSVNSFTDKEEKEVGKDKIVPFLLESRLRERGGNFMPGENWSNQVVYDDRLITGQNPQSASTLGQTIVNVFHQLENRASIIKGGDAALHP